MKATSIEFWGFEGGVGMRLSRCNGVIHDRLHFAGGKSPAENAELVHFSAEVMSGGMAANLDDMAGDIGRQIQSAAAAGDAVNVEGDSIRAVDESNCDMVPRVIVGDGSRRRDLADGEAAEVQPVVAANEEFLASSGPASAGGLGQDGVFHTDRLPLDPGSDRKITCAKI